MRRAAAALLAVAVALPAASCGDDDEPAGEDPSATTESQDTTAPSTTLSPEAEVEAAYREWEAVMTELITAPDPDDPRLPELVAEPQLAEIRDRLQQAVDTNQFYEIGEATEYDITSITISPTGITATLIVCAVGADTLIDGDTGNIVAEGASTSENEVTLRKDTDAWLIENIRFLRGWEGVTTCDRS